MRNSIRPSIRRTRLLGAGTAILAAIALVGLAVTPAAAARGPVTTTEDYVYDNWSCGYPMEVKGQITTTFRDRPSPAGVDRPFTVVNSSYAETWTNASGDSFSASGKVLRKDMKITSLGGSLYQITFQMTGQPNVVTAHGSVLARDRGLFRYTYTYDSDTGAEEFVGVTMNGPHPLFVNDLCKIVAPVVGNSSAEHHTPRPLGTTDAGMGYYEYLPPSYDAGGSPLLVVANGYGENGDGSAEALNNLLFTGIPRFIDVGGWPLERPFVVLSTQHVQQEPFIDGSACDAEPWPGSCNLILQHTLGHPAGSGCTTPDELHDFISYAVAHYDVDPTRVYVTGLSCGAFGVWEYLANYGDEQVAAAVPYAGEGRPAWATSGCALGAVPVWALAGELDDVVNPLGSIEPINALSACPGVTTERAKLTIYPDLYHEGWDEAYSGAFGDDIYAWMLSYSN